MENLKAIRDGFHTKVICHRFASMYHKDPDQRLRHRVMWKYNFHIYLFLHVFIQRKHYEQAEQEYGECTSRKM